MSQQVTELVSVSGWKNLWVQAVADGYQGSPIIKSGAVINFNATTAYLHITNNGSTNPATGTDGLPLSSTAANAPSSAYTLPNGTDLAGVWIFTSGAQDIRYTVTGA
jgi:hypothetical protein